MIYLDFDGVLFDSAREAYVISCLVANKTDYISNEEIYIRFLQARTYVTAAWNYEPVMNVLAERLQGAELAINLNKILAADPTEAALIFERKFFQTRALECLKNYNDWLALSPPFRFWGRVLPWIEDYVNEFTVLSTKDEPSIKEMLTYHRAPQSLRVLGRDAYEGAGRSKASVIDKDPLRSGRSILLDDSLAHLNAVRNIPNVTVVWARWGYVPVEDRQDNSEEALTEIKQLLRNNNASL